MRSINEANSITIDLKENIYNSNTINKLVTKRIRSTTDFAHVFYLENNLKDTLSYDKYVVSSVTNENNRGFIIVYLNENKSYYWLDANEYFNQTVGNSLKLNYLSNTDAISILDSSGELIIIDKDDQVVASFESVKYYKNGEGDYSKFFLYKNNNDNKRYFIPSEILDKNNFTNINYNKPNPIFSK